MESGDDSVTAEQKAGETSVEEVEETTVSESVQAEKSNPEEEDKRLSDDEEGEHGEMISGDEEQKAPDNDPDSDSRDTKDPVS